MRREQMATAGIGLLAAVLVGAGLMAVGGPEQGRAERRDDARLGALRAYAECLSHMPIEELSTAPADICADKVALLLPEGDTLRFEAVGSTKVRVCTRFEYPKRLPVNGYTGEFDLETGCLTRDLSD